MGYNTDFKIEVVPDEGVEVDFDYLHFKLNKISDYHFYADSNTELRLNDSKWYDFKKDVAELSSIFKDILFVVDGEGEENGDVWKFYFKNGKFQDAMVRVSYTYDEFDETKLIFFRR